MLFFLEGGGVVLEVFSTELHKVSSFDIKLVSDLSICDGGHCLHVYEARLFTCKVSVAYLFLIRGSVVLIGGLVHLWKIQWSYQGVRAACQSSLRRKTYMWFCL